MQKCLASLFTSVDGLSVALFRLFFGLIMLYEVVIYFVEDRITRYYVNPDLHFHYLGFHWIQPLSESGLHIHFALLGILAFFIAVGLFYRISATLFFFGFTYVFLLEQAQYLNHFYLICLLSFLLIVVPAHNAFSLDRVLWRRGVPPRVPQWSLFLLRFQIAIPFFYGGLMKVNADWLRGFPLRSWISDNTDFPFIGQYFTETWMAISMSWAGMILDLLIVPMLLWRKTRFLAFALGITFNMMNDGLFSIGIFPVLMTVSLLLFFDPSWPRLVWNRLVQWKVAPCDPQPRSETLCRSEYLTVFVISLFVVFQLLFPLRHFVYPGDVRWNEHGHKFSWRMKLRDKEGRIEFLLRETATGKTWMVDPESDLSKRQLRKIKGYPEMILEYAHHLGHRYSDDGIGQVEVFARSTASVNGREEQLFADPNRDLMTVSRWDPPADWILPLWQPLPDE